MTDERKDDQVILDDEKDLVLEHEADGIKELDNLLPRWWVWLFYITIVFSVIYMIYYHVAGAGRLQDAKYEQEMARAEEALAAQQAAVPRGALLQALPEDPSTNATVLARGQTVYTANCVACHLDQGQGLVGPNLTDVYWIHDGSFKGTVRTINEGVPAKGMISWKAVLSQDDIYAVASYIYTLRGSRPPNPKAPEGEEYIPAS